MLIISKDLGYEEKHTEGVSSLLFTKDRKIFKLNKRLTVERQTSDLEKLKYVFSDFIDHIPETKITTCEHEGRKYTCVTQPLINGTEIKYLSRLAVDGALKQNKSFMSKLMSFFFEGIENQKLYPDIVGFPSDPTFFNSINLLVENGTNKIILCDVNLSPHEDTIKKHGEAFYKGKNIQTYLRTMSDFKEYLDRL